MEREGNEFVEVSVQGKSEVLWVALKQKLLASVNSFLDTVIDKNTGNTIKEEAQELTSLLLKFAKDHLSKPGLENQKIIAEIEELYSSRNKKIAETRKINAEAGSIELKNRVNSLKISLGLTKVLMVGSTDENAVVFFKEIDSLLSMIDNLKLDE